MEHRCTLTPPPPHRLFCACRSEFRSPPKVMLVFITLCTFPASFLCNYSPKREPSSSRPSCAHLWKTVSFDYNVNAAASDRGAGWGGRAGTSWYAFYQDDLCKLCTLFPQESLFWKCQDKLPEISHKIHYAGSVRWRPPWSQGHQAAAVPLGLVCLPPLRCLAFMAVKDLRPDRHPSLEQQVGESGRSAEQMFC